MSTTSTPRPSLSDRHLYLCTPDRPDLEGFVAACVRGGVDVVQLREKELPLDALRRRAEALQRICSELGVPFIVNDRPELAAEVGAQGVHVGQDDTRASDARRIVGASALVGLSTHDRRQLRAALLEPVDYISAGPVVPTPTKPGRPGTGIDYVAEAVRQAHAVGLPVFVTGGVTPATVPALAAAGVEHFVVVRWLTEARDPEGAARALRRTVDGALRAREPAAGIA